MMARVFLVEDETYIREVLRGFLEAGGHEVVVETGDFDEALSLAKETRDRGINLAVLDGSLRPHSPRDGEEIAATLRREMPEIKIIGLSALQVIFGDTNLQKPVTLGEFLQAVAKLGL